MATTSVVDCRALPPLLLVLVLWSMGVHVAAATCTDKVKCMTCLINDALPPNSPVASKFNSSVDPCKWPGIGCDAKGNIISIILDGLPLSTLKATCIPDSTQRLSAQNLNLNNAITWPGHPNMQSFDFSGNGLRCIVSDPALLEPPVGCIGLLGTFNSLQYITVNQMSYSGGFTISLMSFQALLAVVADTGTITKQLFVRNCPLLQTIRIRGAAGYAIVSEQTTNVQMPTPYFGTTLIYASIVVQSAASLTNFSCVSCALVTAILTSPSLLNVIISGANFGTVLATNTALPTATVTSLLTGSPQLNATAGLWLVGTVRMRTLWVTSSMINCFDLGGLKSLLSLDVSYNSNLTGIITSNSAASSAVQGRTCPTAGVTQLLRQPSALLEEMIATNTSIYSFSKSSQYSTLRKLILANNSALQYVFVCQQPLSMVDVSYCPNLVGEIGSRRAPISTVGVAKATGSCCGGVTSTFTSDAGSEAVVQCGCPYGSITAPTDYVTCLHASSFPPDACTSNAQVYDPNLNPNDNPNPIFGPQTTLTAVQTTPGYVDITLSGVGVTGNTYPMLLPTGAITIGVDALRTNESLQYTLASWSPTFTFTNQFGNGLPDAYRPNNPAWVPSLDTSSCTARYVYRVDLSNLRGDGAFLTVSQTGNVATLRFDVTLIEAMPVSLNDNTYVHYSGIRRVLTLQILLEPVVQTGCGMTLRGNVDATNPSVFYLSIVNYLNITATHIESATVDPNQTPAGFFQSRCTTYAPSPPYLPEGIRCTGGAFAQITTVKATVNIVTVTNGVRGLCLYNAQSQYQAPVYTSVQLGPSDNSTKPPTPAGTFSTSCGTSPATMGTVVIYTTSALQNVTVRVILTNPSSGLAVVITDDPSVFNYFQRWDSTQNQIVASFQPTGGVSAYPRLYSGSSITATATVLSSNRRQSASNSGGDQIVFTLDPTVVSLAASNGTSNRNTSVPPSVTNASNTTTPPPNTTLLVTAVGVAPVTDAPTAQPPGPQPTPDSKVSLPKGGARQLQLLTVLVASMWLMLV